jgi:hypothetical protein
MACDSLREEGFFFDETMFFFPLFALRDEKVVIDFNVEKF